MHPHSIADYAHAFGWLMLIPAYALLFGVGHWIAERFFSFPQHLKR